MYFTLTCLDRACFLRRDPQYFEHYHDAITAAGIAMETVEQGSVIEVAAEGRVLLRMRCEKAPQVPPAALLPRGPEARPGL